MTTEIKIILIVTGILLLLLTIVLSSRSRIRRVYRRYLKVGNSVGLTGSQFASTAIDQLDLNITLGVTDGELADAYSPKQNMLIMSRQVCDTASLASLTITAHELGHAMQQQKNDTMFGLSQIWRRINRFTSKFFTPLLIASFIVLFFNMSTALTLLWIAIGVFIFNFLEKIITIPVEYNASKRALWYLKEYHYVSNTELHKAKKLLGIAAQTYIASLFDGLIIFGNKLNALFSKGGKKKRRR
ncbi:MAG: zinc metallopeptidase [Clostridia bacterium]|nr:zinc metallopeptidase [Clostridia bacterium]